MGLLDNLRKNRIKNKTITLDELTAQVADVAENGKPLNLSGVYSCVEIISNTIAKLPFFVMNRRTKEHIDGEDDLYMLLNYKPNEYMNAFTMKKLMISCILLNGNCYIYPVFKGVKLTQLVILPQDVDVNCQKRDGKVYYTFMYENKVYYLRYDELVHLKAYTTDGITGISPLTYARKTIDVGLNQESYQRDFYRDGGRPSGVLQTASDISSRTVKVPQADGTVKEVSFRKYLLDAWAQGQAGDGRAFRTALLDNGITYKTIDQISPADMDFVNSKTVNLEDIARYFNVPAYKLGVGKQTYSNNEQAQIDYITNCIVPLLTQIEQEFTLKLLTKKQRDSEWVIKANVEAELRGDTATRASWYDKMRSMGVYNIDEIRAFENLPQLPDGMGEVRLIGANSVPLERLINGESAADVTPNSAEVEPNDDSSSGKDEQQ